MTTEHEGPSDDCLVRGAQAGNPRDFEILFDRYYAMIYAFGYRLCLETAEAEDLAQETFIRAARGIASYRANASFKNWLFRIAHHVAIDRQRQRERRRAKEAAFAAESDSSSSHGFSDHDAVHAALVRLPAEWREAVVLVYFEDLNHRDAAAVMGCAETTLSWRIFKAKGLLKKVLGRAGEMQR